MEEKIKPIINVHECIENDEINFVKEDYEPLQILDIKINENKVYGFLILVMGINTKFKYIKWINIFGNITVDNKIELLTEYMNDLIFLDECNLQNNFSTKKIIILNQYIKENKIILENQNNILIKIKKITQNENINKDLLNNKKKSVIKNDKNKYSNFIENSIIYNLSKIRNKFIKDEKVKGKIYEKYIEKVIYRIQSDYNDL